MKAVVVMDDSYVVPKIGEELEIIGFVVQDVVGLTALYRTDDGRVCGVPTRAIRMLPRISASDAPESAKPLPDFGYQMVRGSVDS